jgi:transcriptional regulator with XRE-family HTH domain
MNRIKQLREENKWTQLELSQKIDCAMSSIAMYEKEERKPSLEVLVKLSEAFNCSIDYILCKSDIRNQQQSEIPEVRVIERGAKKMSQKDRERMVNMIKLAFEEAFNEDSDNK